MKYVLSCIPVRRREGRRLGDAVPHGEGATPLGRRRRRRRLLPRVVQVMKVAAEAVRGLLAEVERLPRGRRPPHSATAALPGQYLGELGLGDEDAGAFGRGEVPLIYLVIIYVYYLFMYRFIVST